MVIRVCLVLLLALTEYSSATYCVCKDGLSNQTLQKTIDYACEYGADCLAILQNGSCYQPNTVKDHCNYAANSYFQRMEQAVGTCDFSGTANTSSTIANQTSGCIYPASPSSTSSSSNSSSTTNTTGVIGPFFSGPTPTSVANTNASMGLFQGFSLAFIFAFSGFLLL